MQLFFSVHSYVHRLNLNNKNNKIICLMEIKNILEDLVKSDIFLYKLKIS